MKRFICVCGMLIASTDLFAQTSPKDLQRAQQESERVQRLEQERLQRQRDDLLRGRPRGSGIDASQLVPAAPEKKLVEGCREVGKILVKGANLISKEVQDKIVAPYSSRCLSNSDLVEIQNRLTEAYVRRGNIGVRVYLPNLKDNDSTLEVLVIEGFVESVIVRDNGAKSVSIPNAFGSIVGSVLNLRDIEQGLDQINRLRSNGATMQILPGDEVGGSVVAIDNAPRFPLGFSLSYNNRGTASTGEHQLGASVLADNLLGFNDFLSYSHNTSEPMHGKARGSASNALTFSLPFDYMTWTLGASRSHYTSTLPTAARLVSTGSSQSNFMKGDYVAYRNRDSRLNVSATLTTKDSKNYLNDSFLSVSSRKLTVLDVDGSFNTSLAGGLLGMDLGWARGLKMLGALRDADALPDSAPRAQFSKFKYGASYNRPFEVGSTVLNYSVALSGQVAKDVLHGSEQQLIGGIYTVRGHVLNTLSGDSGQFWRNELSAKLPMHLFDTNLLIKPYIAYDRGSVRQHAGGGQSGSLSGYALGVNLLAGALSLDVFSGKAIGLAPEMQRESSKVFFQVALSL